MRSDKTIPFASNLLLLLMLRIACGAGWREERRLNVLYFNSVLLPQHQDVLLEMCAQNILLPPASMASPDCVGHLMKLGTVVSGTVVLGWVSILFFFLWFGLSLTFNANHQERCTCPDAASRPRARRLRATSDANSLSNCFHFYIDSENNRKRYNLFIFPTTLCWCREQWPTFGSWKWERYISLILTTRFFSSLSQVDCRVRVLDQSMDQSRMKKTKPEFSSKYVFLP